MTTNSLTLAGTPVQLPDALGTAADPADELLLEAFAPGPAPDVLALGTGPALPAALALRGARVVVADHRVHVLDAVRATLDLNRVDAVLVATPDLAALADHTRDIALVNIAFQPNAARLAELLREALRLVRPGGRVVVAGARNRGADTAIRRLGEIVGVARLAGYRQGYRVGVAVVGNAPETNVPADPAPTDGAARFDAAPLVVTVRGATYTLEPDPGVFAGGRLDPAALLLAEVAEVGPSDTVLDMGCGNGILGMVAARLAPAGHAWLVDANAEAVALARRNLERNEIGNATVLASDRVAAVRDRRFDVVISNPPFHEGRRTSRDIGHVFIADAATVLRPGGLCFVVANRFLAYEPTMRAHFAAVREVAGDSRYKVLRGER